jgi:hypothetical protein
MSDLALFVAAALRDKVLHDLMEEHQTLREEKASLACRIGSLMQVSVRSPHGHDLGMQSPGPDGKTVESADLASPRIRSIQELFAAQVWLGRPRLLFLDSLSRLSVDSVLYTRVDPTPIEGHGRQEPQGAAHGPPAARAQQNRATSIRIDTRWVIIHVVVETPNGHDGLLDPDSVQMITLGSGHETVADVLRPLRDREVDDDRSAATATTVVHQIEIHSVSRAFVS